MDTTNRRRVVAILLLALTVAACAAQPPAASPVGKQPGLLKAQQTEAVEAAKSDPRALERYKALEARRLELRQRLKPSTPNGA